MAIPIILIGKYGPHSNMLIIRKKTKKNPIRNMGAYLNKTIIKKEENETTWEIEHFEPHGRQYSEERDVNKAIDELVHDILKYDHEYNEIDTLSNYLIEKDTHRESIEGYVERIVKFITELKTAKLGMAETILFEVIPAFSRMVLI